MADSSDFDNEVQIRKDNLMTVSVEHVEIGMFVVDLDRPWIDTPFLIQGFEVRDQNEIDTLREYCRYVYVLKEAAAQRLRASRTRAVPLKVEPMRGKRSGKNTATPDTAAARRAMQPLVRKRPAYTASNLVRREHARARQVLDAGRMNIKSLLAAAHGGSMIDTEVAEATVTACVKSILANPNAMLWMTRIKDQNEYTAEHCLNVCVLAIAFGRYLRMEEDDLHLLGLCGLLHDVGKMRIPSEILDKPGALTAEEFEIMKLHTTYGRQLLEQHAAGLPEIALDVAYSHHERPDGLGYPLALSEHQLSEFGRIISVVDAYDAITSNRCYAPERPATDAQRVIFQNRGRQFDEQIALHFMQAIGPYPPGTLVELRNGMVGIVLSGKPKFRHLPTVLLVRDADKQPIGERTVELHLTDSGALGKEFLIKRILSEGDYGISVRDYQVLEESIPL